MIKNENINNIMNVVMDNCGEPKFNPESIPILEKRYLMRDGKDRVVETPKAMLARVASTLASAELDYDASEGIVDETAISFYNVMANCDFLPNSPCLKGAGIGINMAACYYLDIEDSRKSIFDTLATAVDIQAMGGGVGFNFSKLRAKGSRINSTGGYSSGPVSFMQIFDLTIGKVITQGGGTRAGASIAILMYDHPDIIEYIESKNSGSLTNFNISVGITEKFMEMAMSNQEYSLVNPSNGEVTGKLNAHDLLMRIAKNAWETGDPGILYMDRIERANPTPSLGKLGVNPCSEANLLPFESCVLGSINLNNMLYYDEANGVYKIDSKKLNETVSIAVRMLDNIIDTNNYPMTEIENATKANRKIGLGVMGFADALIKMNIPYNSQEGIEMGRTIMNGIYIAALVESEKLAEEKSPFPNWDISKFNGDKKKRRNASLTLVAPTGTLSTLAGVSGGIEPHFLLAYNRNTLYKDGIGTAVVRCVNKELLEYISVLNLPKEREEEIISKLVDHGTISDVNMFPELMSIKDVFVTSHDISYIDHLMMQDAFQDSCEQSISKTVNLKHNATVDDVYMTYVHSYKSTKVKGVTVYRDGCKENQVLNKIVVKDVAAKEPAINEKREEKKPFVRPRVLPGLTHKVETPVGKLYMTVTELNGQPYEVFLNIGKAGADITADAEGYGRMLSTFFKNEIPLDEIVDQLSGIGGSNSVGFGPNKVRSLPDAIAMVLNTYVVGDADVEGNITGDICPECGHLLVHQERCNKCRNCGYSRC